ncbi:BglG family transcription antiterminator [Celerinatantimonas diazotrophica]|uniref:BglG family transcriptional antiterminator n=1 Tax=Celerinatantimonas diazotrophica TaxID=412034 RepID=A0A4R1KAL2_9GAMM|nr:HTH domain-containing protein [Celerinatantimonas diazotrophica]TCK61496.1 BglG family transcriptional antiterminator [Celerinatantimonas diazotrophica]CAG9296959.1 Transcriptional regulator MtlR [Celerinatantimonas diazotrophica]
MILSKRQKNILDYLVQEDNFITAKELSTKFNVSEKTIYREIKNIKESQSKYMDIIINHIGKGFKINYEEYINKFSSSNNSTYKKHAMSTSERREKILIYLLLSSPEKTSISRLAELYMISASSIAHDLDHIKEILNDTKVKLIKTNQGTFIDGDETKIRELLKNFIINIITNNDYSYDLILLQDYFLYEEIVFTKNILKYIISRDLSLEEPYYINIFIYIIVTIKRIKSGQDLGKINYINRDKTKNPSIKKIANELAKKISSYTKMVLNEYEKENLYYLIYSSRFSENYSIDKFDSSNEEIECVNFINSLIVNMVDECSAKFFDSNELRRNLMPHVRLLIMRLKHHINIHNPLLGEIRSECYFLFNSLTKIIEGSNQFNKYKNISHDEIGYLTLYFQYYYEQHLQSLNVVIVCSTGIGTSHLLKGRVIKSFPKWKIIDIIPFSKINEIQHIENIDLILTTINIDSFDYKVPYVHVSAFINEKDIDSILKITKDIETSSHPSL